MEVEFRLPHLGENISAAEIVKINVSEGDKIEIDQVAAEIETDKATVEIPSDISGIVKKVFLKKGDKPKIGETLFTVEVTAAGLPGIPPQPLEPAVPNEPVKSAEPKIEESAKIKQSTADASPKSAPYAYEFKIPILGENISSAVITKILVKPGDKVEPDQIVLEIETDKATVEIPAEFKGIIKEVSITEGSKVAVGAVAFRALREADVNAEVKVKSEAPPVKKSETAVQQTEEKQTVWQQKIEHSHQPTVVTLPPFQIPSVVVPAAPSVRRFAREIGIDIHQVTGSGPSGRISIDDVKAFSKALNLQIQKGGLSGSGFGFAKEALPDFTKWGETEVQSMSNIRRKTAEHLSYAWSTVPHVTQFDKADITELEKLRKHFGKKVEDAGGKLTATVVLLKILASALKVFPQFNSSLDLEKNEIIYKKFFNIGVAVDTDRGLLVPVLKNIDKKNIIQLAVELADLSRKARDKKLGLDEMQGGCFTVSNLGGIGGTSFTPIVNTPEVAILGISRSAYEPVFIDGKFEPRLMMPLSLSYDHRVIDGADGIRFLRWVINALENPFLISLEG